MEAMNLHVEVGGITREHVWLTQSNCISTYSLHLLHAATMRIAWSPVSGLLLYTHGSVPGTSQWAAAVETDVDLVLGGMDLTPWAGIILIE